MNEKKKFKSIEDVLDSLASEQVRWLFNRYDNWRASIASRCSIVLSADALLLAGESFLLDKLFSVGPKFSIEVKIFIVVCIFISLSLIIYSLINATIGIANVFKSSRQSIAKDTPNRLLFHPSDAVISSKSYNDFLMKYSNLSVEDINNAIWSEIWTLVNLHNQRYQNLRKGIKFLVASIPFYVLSIAAIIFSFLFNQV